MMKPVEIEEEEFFIGWQGKMPLKTAQYLAAAVTLVVLLAVLCMPSFQDTIGRAWFDYGNVREFTGVLVKEPVPILLAGEPDDKSGESVYLLVNPLKHGYPAEKANAYHLKPVTIRGTLIYNESGGAMIEVVETQEREPVEGDANRRLVRGGPYEVELQGEIVDSKCWLGVMNPGALKPHRACAINCIRGGIPPGLLVDREEFIVMVGSDGEPINDAVLEHVAIPVSVSGKLIDHGMLKVLMVNPADIRQIAE